MNEETAQEDWKLLAPLANITTAAGVTTGRVDVVTTRAAGPGALANESALFPFARHNCKLRVYLSAASYAVTVRVLGWTYSEELGSWCHETLLEATGISHASASRTILGTALYPVTAWTIVQGSGNSRVVNSTGDKAAASLLIDHQGNVFGEAAFSTAAIRTLNALRKAC